MLYGKLVGLGVGGVWEVFYNGSRTVNVFLNVVEQTTRTLLELL